MRLDIDWRNLPYPEEGMEPTATLSNGRWRSSEAGNDGYALRSIAISLKRIADAMEIGFGEN